MQIVHVHPKSKEQSQPLWVHQALTLCLFDGREEIV
jgi:hypothetical protein